MAPLVLGAALLGLLASPAPAAAQAVTEPGSGAAFSVRRDLLGRRHTVVGVGLRRAYVVFKVYAAGFYVADDDGRPAFRKLLAAEGGDLQRLRRNGRLEQWLTGGDFGRALDFVMLRDVERGKMADTIRVRLTDEIGPLDTPELKPIASRFFGAIDIPLRKGQRFTVVQGPRQEIAALLDGKLLVRVRNKRVAAGIWRVFFGPHAIDPGLKHTLVARLENLLP